MPFRFNPFTDKLDIVDTTAGPGPVISLTGNTGGAVPPTAGNINILGSGAVSVSGNPGTSTLTIAIAGTGLVWNDIGASQTLSVNNGYFCTGGAALSLALPTTSVLGDTIKVSLDGSTSWTITQSLGQQIRLGSSQTTLTTGTLASTAQGDTVELVCETANTKWVVLSSIGNITLT